MPTYGYVADPVDGGRCTAATSDEDERLGSCWTRRSIRFRSNAQRAAEGAYGLDVLRSARWPGQYQFAYIEQRSWFALFATHPLTVLAQLYWQPHTLVAIAIACNRRRPHNTHIHLQARAIRQIVV